MNPVRQGDGVGLSAAGFSEVREGDGTVLWSQGGAIPDSAVLHWRMGAGSGTTVDDDIGTNNGSFNDDPQWAADSNFVDGQKVTLDGSGDYISASNNGTAIGPNTDFSVAITVASDSQLSGEQMIWSWADGSNYCGIFHDGDNIAFQIDDGSTHSASHQEPSAPYTMRLFATWDSSTQTAELYLNGSSSTGTYSAPLFYSDSGLFVGVQQNGSGRYLNANVDDFITMSAIESATDDLNRQPWS